ncbi:MAG: IS5 family transposase [bacterium]
MAGGDGAHVQLGERIGRGGRSGGGRGLEAHEGSKVQRPFGVWFDEDAISAWNAPPSGRPGGQPRSSDVAIATSLTLRLVFHLDLRQTEGFVASLIRLIGLGLDAPDHTTLSRQSRSTEVPRLAKTHHDPIHLVVDSTGLKTLGDGEWNAFKHKTSNKRRAWRKLHLGVDGDGVIIASELTDSSVYDASVGVMMTKQVDAVIERFNAINLMTKLGMPESVKMAAA